MQQCGLQARRRCAGAAHALRRWPAVTPLSHPRRAAKTFALLARAWDEQAPGYPQWESCEHTTSGLQNRRRPWEQSGSRRGAHNALRVHGGARARLKGHWRPCGFSGKGRGARGRWGRRRARVCGRRRSGPRERGRARDWPAVTPPAAPPPSGWRVTRSHRPRKAPLPPPRPARTAGTARARGGCPEGGRKCGGAEQSYGRGMGRLRNGGCWYRSTKEPESPISAGPSPLPKRLFQGKKVAGARVCWGEGDGRAGALCLSCPVPSRPLAAGWRWGVQREPPRKKGSTAPVPPFSHQLLPLGRPAASPGCTSVGCRHVPVRHKPCCGHMCCCRSKTQTHPGPASCLSFGSRSPKTFMLAVKLCLVTSINYWYLNRFSSLKWQRQNKRSLFRLVC